MADAIINGKAVRVEDAAGRYIEFCKSTIPLAMSFARLKIVVDCAHGATYHVAPDVLVELGADVITMGVEPDGFNINRGVAMWKKEPGYRQSSPYPVAATTPLPGGGGVAPVAVVGEEVHGDMTPTKVDGILLRHVGHAAGPV